MILLLRGASMKVGAGAFIKRSKRGSCWRQQQWTMGESRPGFYAAAQGFDATQISSRAAAGA
jgi:hypothetical protein